MGQSPTSSKFSTPSCDCWDIQGSARITQKRSKPLRPEFSRWDSSRPLATSATSVSMECPTHRIPQTVPLGAGFGWPRWSQPRRDLSGTTIYAYIGRSIDRQSYGSPMECRRVWVVNTGDYQRRAHDRRPSDRAVSVRQTGCVRPVRHGLPKRRSDVGRRWSDAFFIYY